MVVRLPLTFAGLVVWARLGPVWVVVRDLGGAFALEACALLGVVVVNFELHDAGYRSDLEPSGGALRADGGVLVPEDDMERCSQMILFRLAAR